ncbi:hypothetical protein MVEN_00918500 [Mycena venus]|uniref:Protein kinase domain-containing protein n=1 Tax=Mycena venus TaxID=2733690 RepID=A0A8H6YCM6_9AGAR|nr:hypothetical protein MVEN_00918500 [Mycena venus]
MDSDYHASTTEFASNSTTYNPQSVLHGSGMFSGSQNFTVTGGTLTNITNNYTTATSLPSDFRMIPLGDIDLQHEIGSDFGAVDRRRGRPRVRRVYTAKIKDRKSSVTVAMYQGDGAEEQWRQDIAKYMVVRHPSIFQIYGAASSGGISATLFHGDMIPLKEFVNLSRNSHAWIVYIYARCEMEFSVRTFDAVVHPPYIGVAGCKRLCLFSITKGTLPVGMHRLDTSLHWSALRGSH